MTHFDSRPSNGSPNNGTAFLRFLRDDQPLTITRQQGSTFSLNQVDLAQYSNIFRTPVVPFIGHRIDGFTVFQTFSLTDGINFNSFSFNNNFSNLLT